MNFEYKKLFPCNIGTSRGEMETAMFWNGSNKLFNSTLKKTLPITVHRKAVSNSRSLCAFNGATASGSDRREERYRAIGPDGKVWQLPEIVGGIKPD